MVKFWKKTTGWKLPLLGLMALIFTLYSILSRVEPPPKEPIVMPTIAPFKNNVAGIGIIEPQSELIAIGTEVSGLIKAIHVRVGEQVVQGTPLFSLDQRDIDARIVVLEAMLESAKVQAEDATAQFSLINSIKDQRAIAKDDYNRRKYAAKLYQKKVAEIEAQIHQARITRERLTITAPINGTVLDINIHPGEFAAPMPAEPLIRMGDTGVLHIRVEFDEENAARLSPNAPAKAYKRGDTAQAYPLTFIRFESYVAPKQNLAVAGQRVDTRVLQAIYSLPPEAQHLLVGQQMDVYVEEYAEGKAGDK